MKHQKMQSISYDQKKSLPFIGKSLTAFTLSLYGCTVPVVDQVDVPPTKTLVVNGYEGASEDFPAIGAFVDDGGMEAICTVSLIRKDLALTAAHCISPDGSNPNGLGRYNPEYILHGLNETLDEYCEEENLCNKYLHHVVAAARHPKYDDYSINENHHDFALLLLEKEIADAEPIELLPNALFEEALAIGDTVTIAGYGRHYDDYGSFWKFTSGKLYAADVPVMGYHNEAEIIVGEKDPTKGNACYGDSGGPIYVYSHGKVQLTGVASRLTELVGGGWQCGYSVIYSLPTLEKEWIDSEYKNLRQKYPLALPVVQNIEPSDSASCQFSPKFSSNGNGFLGLGMLLGLYALRRRKI